jgi:hypothetical protein
MPDVAISPAAAESNSFRIDTSPKRRMPGKRVAHADWPEDTPQGDLLVCHRAVTEADADIVGRRRFVQLP